jgi:translation elongation factor EF-G
MQPLLIELAAEAKSPADRERLESILEMLAVVDDSFGFAIDGETGQTILRGRDEAGLERIVARITRDLGVALNLGGPQVFYRETPGRRTEIDYTHKDQSGWGQFARVKLVFEPGEPGSGYRFESKIVGGSVPKKFIPGVEKGLEASREFGVLAGFPVIDFKATLVDGAYHDVDSSVLAFEIAARWAFKEGLRKAQCKAARADHESQDRRTVRICRRDRARSRSATRLGSEPGETSHFPDHSCVGAVGQHVRLWKCAAFDNAAAYRCLHHDLRSLRAHTVPSG